MWAASAPVALVSSPDVASLCAYIRLRAAASGPIVTEEQMAEGLEFRIALRREAALLPILVIVALLKPDLPSLIDPHDDDPEAQSPAATRFLHLLRIHVGTRAWHWEHGRETDICDEAAAWVDRLRSHPILIDHLGPDGEPGCLQAQP